MNAINATEPGIAPHASTGHQSPHGAASTETSLLRDAREIETLIRLIVRDELRYLADSRSPGMSGVHSNHGSNDPRSSEQSISAADGVNDGNSNAEVMCADDVAAFLGVDRNTVYDYAGRGTIPCRRLGKRLLFHRRVLVAWLDPSKAASTRKD